MILADTVIITLFALLNIGIAFAVLVVMAARFGAGSAMDAYLAATTVPFLLRSIFINAIGFAFIPLFVQYRTKSGEKEAWNMCSDLFNILLIALAFLTILVIIFSAWAIVTLLKNIFGIGLGPATVGQPVTSLPTTIPSGGPSLFDTFRQYLGI